MNDMSAVIVPRSDQINADSLLAGPITITITTVEIRPGTEQPVSIHYEGDNGKPYKCCKSMARVLVHCWGADANQYVGRSMTLFCDPKIMWGGMAVGGIRISHLSGIKAPVTMALTATKGNKKPFTVKPLIVEEDAGLNYSALARAAADQGMVSYQTFWKALTKSQQSSLLSQHEDLKAVAKAVDDAKVITEEPAKDDDTFPGDRP